MPINSTLKELREKKGLSMSKVALALEIPKGTYASYEYGQREPNIEMINRVATFYGVTTDYLLGRCEPKLPDNPLEQLPLKELERIIVEKYMELPEKQRELVIDFIHKCVAEEERRKSSISVATQQYFTAARSDNNAKPHLETFTEEQIEEIRNAERVPDDL